MRAIAYVCAAVSALVAVFVGLLASVDLSTPAGSRPLADLGSGAMFDAIADACECIFFPVFNMRSGAGWQTRGLLPARVGFWG